MVTKAEAATAVRAVTAPGKERARLLDWLDGQTDDQLHQWLIQAEDGHDTIVEYIKQKADRAAAAAGGTLGVTKSTMEELLHVISNSQRAILDNQRVITDIVVADLKHAFKPPSTGKESCGSNKGFRDHIVKFYGMGKRLTCMVLGTVLPSEFLVAGHLYAVRWKRYSHVIMGKDFNINSPRNGIIWCSAIEHEYERQRICFSKGSLEVEFILHVLDKSLLPVKLSSVGQHRGNSAFEAALGDITFGDLNKKHVMFTGADGVGPFKHALALHAKFALELCVKTYPDDYNPKEFDFDDLSEYEGKQAFVRMWLGQLGTGSMAEGNEEEEEASVEVHM